MKNVHVLIGGSDRRLNNLIEVAVRNVCFEQLHVECAITRRLDELLHRSTQSEFGLIFVAPDHLQLGPSTRTTGVRIADAAKVIRMIKQHRSVPVIAVGISPQDESEILQAGADHAFGILLGREALGTEVRRVLNLREKVTEEAESSRTSFASGLFRGWQRFRQA